MIKLILFKERPFKIIYFYILNRFNLTLYIPNHFFYPVYIVLYKEQYKQIISHLHQMSITQKKISDDILINACIYRNLTIITV